MQLLKDLLPDTARDLRLNLDAVTRGEHLDETRLWGSVLACALASRNPDVVRAAGAEAATHLSPEALSAVRSVAAVMAMNNVWYRFAHLVGDEAYGKLPARLRMQGLRAPGAEPADLELWALAVSAINGCGACVSAHERQLRRHGLAPEAVAEAARIAAVIHAMAVTLDGEAALACAS